MGGHALSGLVAVVRLEERVFVVYQGGGECVEFSVLRQVEHQRVPAVVAEVAQCEANSSGWPWPRWPLSRLVVMHELVEAAAVVACLCLAAEQVPLQKAERAARGFQRRGGRRGDWIVVMTNPDGAGARMAVGRPYRRLCSAACRRRLARSLLAWC